MSRPTFVFKLDIEQEEDGRWSAVLPELVGCYAWGYTREEALHALETNVRDFLLTLEEMGQLPHPYDGSRVFDTPVLAVSA